MTSTSSVESGGVKQRNFMPTETHIYDLSLVLLLSRSIFHSILAAESEQFTTLAVMPVRVVLSFA